MNEMPPPLPPSVGSSEPSAFARQAANACLAAPLLIFALSFCTASLLHDHRDASGRPLLVIASLAVAGFCIVGAVLGVLAIVLAKPGQRGSVFLRASCGLVLLGLLVAIAVPNFVRSRTLALQRKQAFEEVHTAAVDLRSQAVAALTNAQTGGVDAQQLRQSLSRAEEKSSGETAALLKGNRLYLERLQSYQEAYARAANELTAAKVLAAANLTQRGQINSRKALVQKFLDANDACKTFVLQGESNYREELAAAGVAPAQTQAAVNGFRRSLAAQSPLMANIRVADDRMGRAMLGVLDLFDTHWDQWSYDASAGVVRFQNNAALGQYNALMAEIKQAGADQAAAQKRLAALMNKSTTSL
jgi:type II secretory pathway pseudopilin PulG